MKRGLIIALTVVVAGVITVLAQGPGLPEDLSNYLGWERANAQKSFEESAHPVAKDIYMNDTAAATAHERDFPYAEGSIFVKETTDPDALAVTVITAMRKVNGFNPDNGDWQYGMFERQEDGNYMGEWMSVEGAAMCIGCHVDAADTDYTFLTYLTNR